MTVLFCDVTGSTALAEQMDPEEWTAVMDTAFKRLIESAERYGGTVARLMGDAVNVAARMEQTAEPGPRHSGGSRGRRRRDSVTPVRRR